MDLRPMLPPAEWRQLLREAHLRRLPLDALFTDGTRSELERRFLALCRRHAIPMPAVNARVGRFTVDFLWEAERLVVEVDGWGTHGTRAAFEDDRSRDAALQTLGYQVVRFTWRQMAEGPDAVVAVLRALLALG